MALFFPFGKCSLFSRGRLTFFLYLYLNSTHSFYIYNALQYVILSFIMHLDHLLASVLFLRKLYFLYLIPSLAPFSSVNPRFPCPSVSFSHPLCGLLPIKLCIWVMLYRLWQSQLCVLPITCSSHTLGALASHLVSVVT